MFCDAFTRHRAGFATFVIGFYYGIWILYEYRYTYRYTRIGLKNDLSRKRIWCFYYAQSGFYDVWNRFYQGIWILYAYSYTRIGLKTWYGILLKRWYLSFSKHSFALSFIVQTVYNVHTPFLSMGWMGLYLG